MNKIFFLLIFLFILPMCFAEQTGTINITTASSFLTGLRGSTVFYCNSTADCENSAYYTCILDYDGESTTNYMGWCASASRTECAHLNSPSPGYENVTSGTGFCVNSTAYRTCSSGVWSAELQCSSSQTCQNSACSSASSSSSSSSSFLSVAANASFIRIVSYPGTLSMIPGSNFSFTLVVANGNTIQKNLTINMTGFPSEWFRADPWKVGVVYPQTNASFILGFSVPLNTSLQSYNVVLVLSTSNSSVSGNVSFVIHVVPSNTTIEGALKPSISSYENELAEIEKRFSGERASMDEVQAKRIQNLIDFTKNKINQTKALLDQGNYPEFNDASEEIRELISELNSILASEKPSAKTMGDIVFLAVFSGVVLAAILAAYFLIRPGRESGYRKETGWISSSPKKTGLIKKIAGKIRKKRKEESYFDKKGK